MTDIVQTEGVMGGQPRLDGHRISVLQLAEWILDEGMRPETVASEFDLDLADIHRALAYYYDNIEQMRTLRAERHARIEESRNNHPDPESVRETA
jgi:uncharacterized protein (DUF433 family)